MIVIPLAGLLGFGCSSVTRKPQVTEPDCVVVSQLAEIEEYLNIHRKIMFEEIAEFAPLTPKELPVVLVHGPNCAILISGIEPFSIIQTTSPITFLTPVYSFYLSGDLNLVPEQFKGLATLIANLNPEIQSALTARGISRALLLRLDFDQKILDQAIGFRTRAQFLAFMAIHESFHLHGQFPQWLSSEDRRVHWPSWDQQPNRKQLLRECYPPTFAEELKSLNVALKLGLSETNGSQARNSARLFEKKRVARHNSLRDTKIKLADGTFASCAVAESIMELEEGMLDSLALHVLVHHGVMSRAEALMYVLSSTNEPFYRTGAGQMLLQTKLDPKAHIALFQDLNARAGLNRD